MRHTFTLPLAITVFTTLCYPVLSHSEYALIINKDGLGANAKFGDVVEVSISKSALGVTFGGEKYPAGSFAINNSGCFEVGVSEGLGSVYEDAKFKGTGTYRTVEFTSTINPTLDAGIEICPQVIEPLHLKATTSKEQRPHDVQPMAVSGVRVGLQGPQGIKPGASFSLDLSAFCLDITKDEPDRGTELAPASQPISNHYVQYLLDDTLSLPEKQQCIWLSDSNSYFAYNFDGSDLEFVEERVQKLIDEFKSKCALTTQQEQELRGNFDS